MSSASLAFLAGRDGRPKTDYHEWFDDFDLYLSTSWVKTETGSGTQAIAQAKDGVLVLTNAAADNDVNSFQARDVASGQVAEHWKFTAGKKLYWGMRFKVSDDDQIDWLVGLHITATTPIASAPTDGIYFRKDDGDTKIDFVVAKNSTVSEELDCARAAANTYMVLEFYYGGKVDEDGATAGYIQAFKDGVNVGNYLVDSNLPDDEELVISFAVQNGEAVAKSMSIDWIRVLQERG